MTSPVSIGDAFLMAKLALTLGRAFTSGRKSAPEEFMEVESQLYSISTALSALDKACQTTGLGLGVDSSGLPPSLQRVHGSRADDALVAMLQGCQEILKHLEAMVNDYTLIIQPKESGGPALRRWSKELKKNWKKVWWTTEGGDLATLRRSLSIHINSLNLALGVINHTQANRVETQVDHVAVMLTEIHTWFVDNIKNSAHSPANLVQRMAAASLSEPPLNSIRFELFAESKSGLEALCPISSVHPDWNSEGRGPVFQCHCSREPDQPTLHSSQLDSLGLSPLSFAMRRTGPIQTWMIYKASNRATSRLQTLIIKGVPAARIHEFETSFIEVLAADRARSMLRRNMGTMLAYNAVTGSSDSVETRILNLSSNLQAFRGQVEKVNFTINRQSYTRAGVESIQLLHYKTSNRDYMQTGYSIYPKDLSPLNTAELVIFYAQTSVDSDTARSILYITHKTVVKHVSGSSTVLLPKIDSVGLQRSTLNDEGSVVRGVDVSIHLMSPKAAEDLRHRILEMRVELFVMSLKAPRPDETLALKIQARGVHTEQLAIANSEISILQSENSGRLRLIVVSEDKATILSQELAEDFMTAGGGGRPNFGSPTYVVQVLGQGTREIHKYNNGFKYFDFSDAYMDRLFGLGLAAFSGSEAPPAQISQGPIGRQLEN